MNNDHNQRLVAELAGASCAVPFQDLGLHHAGDGEGLVLRAWRPDTEAIDVVELATGHEIGAMERAGDSDLFELRLPERREFFPYVLRVRRHGQVAEDHDPYQFRESIFANRHEDANRLYLDLGAHPVEREREGGGSAAGVQFSVYAPAARAVSVVGDFNEWDGRRHPMQSSVEGIWRIFIPGLAAGTLYKFEIKSQAGNMVPRKSDPFAFYCEQPGGNASIVHDPFAYQWQDGEWMQQRREQGYRNDVPLSIYEVHLGSWKRRDGHLLTYNDFTEELVPYVKNMGYTHIELLPVSEHPFMGSWGYQPTGMYAATSRYGPPDDLKRFIDRCHQEGIGVIIDWVPAHFPSDEHGLELFDGTTVFEHPDPRRGWHPDWNTYVYDFGKPFVRDFLVSSAMFWIEAYHVDGLRVDAVASMLYLDYSRNPGEWVPNMFGGNENLEAIDFIKRMNEVVHGEHPGVMTLAEESTAWPRVSKPTYDNGLGFGFKWNMGWMHDTLNYMAKDPVHRRYHHGDLTFGLVYAFDEHFVLPLSHDEVVHGKGSLLGKMPGDDWQRYANLRLYYAFMYAHPGKKLLFMGGEIGQVREWSHDGELDWFLLENGNHRGLQLLTQHLNAFYKEHPALYEVDFTPDGFEWIDYSDADQGVIAFVRYNRDRSQHVLAICNLTPVVRYDYRLGVPGAGAYREALNTDSEYYGGSNVGNEGEVASEALPAHGREHSVSIVLPPLATVYLEPSGGTGG